MKQILCFIITLLTACNVFSQTGICPPNIDFESGGFSFWNCFQGSTSVVNGLNVILLNPTPPVSGRHEIMSATSMPANDPYGGFPVVCPYGGNYSVKLGNASNGSQAEGISYTFQIPPSADTFSITYYYAVVFQDPSHNPEQQPRFVVTAYDVLTGNLINCASYNYVSTGSIPGFQHSSSDYDVLYKDWTPTAIDFSGLAGRTVRLEFKTADCTLGGHFGYSYLDVGTGCGGVIGTGAYCVETNSVILNAPYGFQSYTWYNTDYSVIVGNQRDVTLSPPPPVSTLFHVDMIPYPGYGCRDTADALVTPLPVPDTPVAVNEVNYCQYQFAQPLSAVGLPGNTILWYNSPSGGAVLQGAPIPSTSSAGTFDFYVSQKKTFGCESKRKKITVNIYPTPIANFTINDDFQCQEDNLFAFINTSGNIVAATQFTWTFGDGLSSALVNTSHTYTGYGLYNVSLYVQNPGGCNAQATHPVNISPEPLASFSYPPVICENQTIVTLTDHSTVPSGLSNISSWWWQIGNGYSFIQAPPPFYTQAGNLQVRLFVKTADGCTSDTISNILNTHYVPASAFNYSRPLCENEITRFTDQSSLNSAAVPDYVAKWQWDINNSTAVTTQQVAYLFLPGTHHVSLKVETNAGCVSQSADSVFVINSKPEIELYLSDSCLFRNLRFTANVLSGAPVQQWLWDFGNGFKAAPPSVNRVYSIPGNQLLVLMGLSNAGCRDTVVRPFTIFTNNTVAGKDTIAAMNEPVLLNTNGEPGMAYSWIPAAGLNNPSAEDPVAILDRDQLYQLITISKEGCDKRSAILVKRFKGPELYIAGAFTPNNDGLNDELRVFPVGIKSFGYFSVYNRFGQLLFTTTDYHKGWNGMISGVKASPDNYVVIATAIDYAGRPMLKKANVILIW